MYWYYVTSRLSEIFSLVMHLIEYWKKIIAILGKVQLSTYYKRNASCKMAYWILKETVRGK